jgi:acetyltransferase-like isoleucine patch superfamily enzyme
VILYIYCAGGFGKEVMDVARRRNNISKHWGDIRFIDDVVADDTKYGAKLSKFDEIIHNGGLDRAEFLIAIGEPAVRRRIKERLKEARAKMSRLIDVSAMVADTARVSDGVVITPFCSISSDAVLASNSCVNTMSIIGHDVFIGENSVISSMVNMGGACIVGENSYIGMGALEWVRLFTVTSQTESLLWGIQLE